jgi:GNAT superfamily N-acetyltransferase
VTSAATELVREPAGTHAVRAAGVADEGVCLDVLVQAFAADPAVRWTFPEERSYADAFRAFARGFAGASFTEGTARRLDRRAVALWLRPGSGPDDAAVVDAITRFTPAFRVDEMLDLLERMGRVHPHGRHLYLPLLGVVPQAQGRGLGSALLRPMLDACDAEGLPVYLEATSTRSVPLYRRHGFEVRDVLVSRTCPPITTMWRPPLG